MDILQKIVRANALLLQGAHEGAEHVLDSAIVDVRELIAENDRLNAERGQLLAQEPAIVVKGRKVVGFNPADGTRIEGEFYAAPMPAQAVPAQQVKMPTNADEAAAMQMIGMAWLEQNAPERLRSPPTVAVPDCVEWSLTWLESALKCESFRWDGDQHEAAKYELEQARLWLSTRTTEPSTRITEQDAREIIIRYQRFLPGDELITEFLDDWISASCDTGCRSLLNKISAKGE